jgi:hypothetical protein
MNSEQIELYINEASAVLEKRICSADAHVLSITLQLAGMFVTYGLVRIAEAIEKRNAGA